MKNPLFGAALLQVLVLSAFAQTTTYEDFKLADQEIIYQPVFQSEGVTYAKLEEYYKKSKNFSNIKISANEMTFNVSDLTVDYLKFQLSQVETPLILQTGKFSGQAAVSIREG